MTLKEYAAIINGLVKAGHGKLTVVHASDDEGNSFHNVHYAPAVIDAPNTGYTYNKAKGYTLETQVVCIN
jgi:hypothetical protein